MLVSNDRAQKKQLDKAESQVELLRKQIAKTETVVATLSSKAKRFDQLMAEMDELVEKQSCEMIDKLKGELTACKKK